MVQDFIQIYACSRLSLNELVNIPKEHQKDIIKRDLGREIGNYIVNNTDKIPNYTRTETIKTDGSEEHIIRINIISDEEYRRLKEIEHMYNSLLL